MNTAVEGKGPMLPMTEYLKTLESGSPAPRLVIWEIPERFLTLHYNEKQN